MWAWLPVAFIGLRHDDIVMPRYHVILSSFGSCILALSMHDHHVIHTHSCIHTYLCTHTQIHVIHVHIIMRIAQYLRLSQHIYIYIHTHTYIHTYTGLAHIHGECALLRARTHTSIHTYIYIYTHTGLAHIHGGCALLRARTHTYIHTHTHRAGAHPWRMRTAASSTLTARSHAFLACMMVCLHVHMYFDRCLFGGDENAVKCVRNSG